MAAVVGGALFGVGWALFGVGWALLGVGCVRLWAVAPITVGATTVGVDPESPPACPHADSASTTLTTLATTAIRTGVGVNTRAGAARPAAAR